MVMKIQVANCGKTVRCHQMAGGEPFIPETFKSQKSKVSGKGMAFPSKPNVLLCTIYFLTLLLHISSIHADATLGPPQHVPGLFSPSSNYTSSHCKHQSGQHAYLLFQVLRNLLDHSEQTASDSEEMII